MGFFIDYILANLFLSSRKEKKDLKEAESRTQKHFNNSNNIYENIATNQERYIINSDVDTIPHIPTFYNFRVEGINDRNLTGTRQILINQLENNPSDIFSRCKLIELIFDQIELGRVHCMDQPDWDYKICSPWDYLICECHQHLIYIVDNIIENGKKMKAIKQLCLMLDGELYLIRGDFINALKRFHNSLLWDDLLESANTELWDENGLEDIHISIVSNIMQVYILFGLIDKARIFANQFKTIIKKRGSWYKEMSNGGDEKKREYNQGIYNAISDLSVLSGFWFFFKSFEGTSDIYDAYYSNFNKYIIYIDAFHEAVIKQPFSVSDEKGENRALIIYGICVIENIDIIIEKQKEVIETIF